MRITIITCFSITLISVFFNFINFNFYSNDNYIVNPETLNSSNSDNFDILEFWQKEIERVNNTPLNTHFGVNSSVDYINPYTNEKDIFTAQEIHFDSPNWVGTSPSILRLHGYLLYPNVIKTKNPGCLCMHGLGGSANTSFKLAYPYLIKGFVVFCHSHPGHGESEGAKPSPQNFYFEQEYNRSSHNYLTLCGAIQGLRLLENLTMVNNSQIMVTGSSYGGLNTMWLSGICGERIAGALPHVAVGDHEKDLEDPTKLLFWIWNKDPNKFPSSFWDNQNLRVDPIYYLKSNKLPPILWQIGTTDEFFHHRCINGTYQAVQHNSKFIQIFPNGHHGLYDYQNNTEYFIDYIINGNPAPPNITINNLEKHSDLLGDTLRFEITIDSDVNIKFVQVAYKYVGILGTSWELKKLVKVDGNIWTGEVQPGIISSEVDYYFIVNYEGNDNVWFSSNMFIAGILNNNLEIISYTLIICGIGLPFIYIFWRRFNKNVKNLDEKFKPDAKKNLIIESISIGATESVFFFSLILPMVTFGTSGVSWSTIFVFNKIYTWPAIFGIIAPYIPAIIITIFILVSYLSLMKPILSSMFKIVYFIYMLLFYYILTGLLQGSSELDPFGAIDLGIGFFVIIITAITLFIIGIWKRYYQAKLDIRTPKKKFYNIDRWFRIS